MELVQKNVRISKNLDKEIKEYAYNNNIRTYEEAFSIVLNAGLDSLKQKNNLDYNYEILTALAEMRIYLNSFNTTTKDAQDIAPFNKVLSKKIRDAAVYAVDNKFKVKNNYYD